MLVYLTFIVLLSISVLSLIEERLTAKQHEYLYNGIGIILVLLAAFRPIGIDNDSETYELYFRDNDNPLYLLLVEYSFLFIAKCLRLICDDVHSIFLLYAAVGISIKFWAFKKLSPLWFLTIVAYMGNYYILHEFTQVRACLAASLLLIAVFPLTEGNRLKALVIILIASVFHYSSVAMLPLLLLSNKSLTTIERIAWASIVPLAYLAFFAQISISSLPIPYIGDKIEAYEKLKDQGFLDEINVFNLVFLAKIGIYLYLLYMYDVIREHTPYITIMIKMLGLSIFSFAFFAFLPVLAFRISELFGIVEAVLFTYIYYTIKPDYLSKSIVIVIGISMFLINVFYNELLQTT